MSPYDYTRTSFTTINNRARRRLNLSYNEYCIADLIYNLANNPKSRMPGWCYASDYIKAEIFGLTRQGVIKLQKRLIQMDLLEKNEYGKYRTTQKWYDNVILDCDEYYLGSNYIIKCFYCERTIDETAIEIDHYYPLSKGGEDSSENKVFCCGDCNRTKGNKTGEEFFKILKKEIKYPETEYKKDSKLSVQIANKNGKQSLPLDSKQSLPKNSTNNKSSKLSYEKSKLSLHNNNILNKDIYEYIESIYFEEFKKKASFDPDYNYGRDRKVLGNIIKNYGKEKTGLMIKTYIQNGIGEWCGYTITGLQKCINKVMIKMKEGGGENGEGLGFTIHKKV